MRHNNHSNGNDAGRPKSVAPLSFRLGTTKSLVAGLLAVFGLTGVGGFLFAERGLLTAERLARHGLWQEVHGPVARYLWLHPESSRANLLAAEALVKDDSIPLVRRITESLECLSRIADTSSEAASGRVAEARIELFLRYEPMAAARSLARACAIDSSSLEAHMLSWKLLELTGRADKAEETFWTCYELSSIEERPLRLREWYVSQFFPLSSTAELDRLMGFRASVAESGVAVEMRRLQRFRLAEPQEPVPHAALAELFLRENEPELAFEVLDEAAGQMPVERQTNPFILGVVVETLLELGETEHARETFERWPEPHEGRHYWLVKGRVLQEADNEPAAAAEAYRASLEIWPGQVDWRTTSRLAGCLARAGKPDAAMAARESVQQIQEAIPQATLEQLLDALAEPGDPIVAEAMARLYQRIGREREANAWHAVAAANAKKS